MQLVLVAHRRRAAFEVAHIGALVGDDQRALELAGIALVDAEIGRQLHRAAHARRHVDEGAVGEHRRVERGEEIVGDRHHRAEIFLHQLGMLLQRLGDRHEEHAGLGELRLEGGRDRDRIEHRVDRDAAVAVAALACPRALDAEQRFPLAQRNAELLVGRENLGIDLVERLRSVLLLRRRVVVEVLVVDRAIAHARPAGLAHGQPAPIGVEPPGEHPLRLVLLRRDEADDVFGEPLGGLVGFDVRLEPILVLIDVDTANLIDGLLYGRHSSLRCGFKDRGLDQSVMVGVSGLPSPSLLRFRRRCPVTSLSNAPDTLIQALMKRSISDSVVVGPRLTRTAPRASAPEHPWRRAHARAGPCPRSRRRPRTPPRRRDRRR